MSYQFLYPNYQAEIQRAGSYGPRQLDEFIYYSEKQSKEGASGVATSIHSPRSMDGSMLSSLGGESPYAREMADMREAYSGSIHYLYASIFSNTTRLMEDLLIANRLLFTDCLRSLNEDNDMNKSLSRTEKK